MHSLFKALAADITETPAFLKQPHLPSLDGLRAISIISVIIFHLNFTYHYHLLDLLFSGSFGVYVFFVISGFLITTLLLKESIGNGAINLKNFYIRRAFRILPVAYLYLFVMVLLVAVLKFPILYSSILSGALFLRNIGIGAMSWNIFINHYWSLSVEEQFYLLFPSAIRKSNKNAIFFVLSFFIIIIFMNIYYPHSYALKNTKWRYLYEFVHQLDGITVGSLMSFLLFKKIIVIKTNIRYSFIIKFLLLVFAYLIHQEHLYLPLGLGTTVSALFIAAFIVLNVSSANDIIYQFLNTKALIHIGILSYSLYIWQQLVTGLLEYKYLPSKSGYFPVYLIAIYLMALCSYFFYEKKFLKLKNKINTKRANLKYFDDMVDHQISNLDTHYKNKMLH